MKSKTLLDAMAKLDQTRRRKAPVKKDPPAPPQLMLPLWPDAVRAIPNALLRGALFGVSQRRTHHNQYVNLTSVEGTEISFKGQTFNQHDLDVLETLLHLAREQPINVPIEFTSHALLKDLGRGTGQNQYEQLIEELERLRDSSIRFFVPGKEGVKREVFYGNMIKKYFRRERHDGTHQHVVVFDEDMLRLYGVGYTNIPWQQRQMLTTSLAKWLHSFFASHADPYPYKTETIQRLCGSTAGRLADFRRMLRKALDELQKAGAIKSYSLDDDDLVKVVKVPTGSQRRHLRKRQALARNPVAKDS